MPKKAFYTMKYKAVQKAKAKKMHAANAARREKHKDSCVNTSPESSSMVPQQESSSMVPQQASSSRMPGARQRKLFLQHEEEIKKDLEVCPDSEDEIESGLVLSNNEKEMIEEETLNSVQRRKKTIEEFDKGLLDKKSFINESQNDSYILMQSSQLRALLGDVTMCRLCLGNEFKVERVEGTTAYSLKCCNIKCGVENSKQSCTKRKLRGKLVSDIIARFSLINVDTGVGYYALANIFTAYGLPVPSNTQANVVTSLLLEEIEDEGKVILERCRGVVNSYYKKHFPSCVNESGKAMIGVCYDGAWKTRGHNSLIGIGFIVDIETNLIVDFHVLCSFCQRCALRKKIMKEEGFDEWVIGHKNKGECDQNFSRDFSSGSMEPEIAKILWERSKNSNLWYTTMVADGDSRSFTKIQEISPYGDIDIEKEECQNHTNKRMKRALNRLIEEEDLRKEKEGNLTETKVNAFANFYSKAIKENVGNLVEMKKAIFASFYHHVQTPMRPIGIHQFCPEGKNSWCFYNKAEHEGKTPNPKEFNHPISLKVLKTILESKVFKDLTTDSLLHRCTGKTQNINESLHSRVWNLVPKEKHRGVKYVKIAMWLVMVKHNLGIAEQGGLCKDMLTPERSKLWNDMEKKRKMYSPVKSKEVKKARIDDQKRKKRRTDYVPGGGD